MSCALALGTWDGDDEGLTGTFRSTVPTNPFLEAPCWPPICSTPRCADRTLSRCKMYISPESKGRRRLFFHHPLPGLVILKSQIKSGPWETMGVYMETWKQIPLPRPGRSGMHLYKGIYKHAPKGKLFDGYINYINVACYTIWDAVQPSIRLKIPWLQQTKDKNADCHDLWKVWEFESYHDERCSNTWLVSSHSGPKCAKVEAGCLATREVHPGPSTHSLSSL